MFFNTLAGSTPTVYSLSTISSRLQYLDTLAYSGSISSVPTLQDTSGNANHAAMDVPCITGNRAASVRCNVGLTLIPATADFDLSFWFYQVGEANQGNVLTQLTGVNTGRVQFQCNFNGAASESGKTRFEFLGSSDTAFTLTDGWHLIRITRTGNNWVGYVDGVSKIAVTVSGSVGQDTTCLLCYQYSGPTYISYCDNQRIAGLQCTTGGVTTYVDLQDGPGSSNTNRSIAWVKSDGTSGVVASAISNGTVSTIWANRCPYVQDRCVLNGGGIAANGAFLAGKIGVGTDAAGATKTLSAGKHGNPYSRLRPNYFNVAALTTAGYAQAVELAPSDAVQSTSIVDAKYRRSSSDGSDRYYAFTGALTGGTKTYVEGLCVGITGVLLSSYLFAAGSGTVLADNGPIQNNGTLVRSGYDSPTWSGGGLLFATGTLNKGTPVTCPSNVMSQVRTIMWFGDIQRGKGYQTVLSGGATGSSDNYHFGLNGMDAMPGVNQAPGSGNTAPVALQPMEGPLGITIKLGTSGNMKVYIGASEVAAYTNNTDVTALATGGSALWLGQWPFFDTFGGVANAPYQGKMYGLLLFSNELSPSQIATNYDVMARQIAARGVTLGNTIPTRPIVCFFGDSITQDILNSTANKYPTLTMGGLSGTYNWINAGKSGSYFAGTPNPDALLSLPGQSAVTNAIVIYQTHDLDHTAGSLQTIYQAYCAARRTAGWKVVASTIVSQVADATPAQLTERLNFNTWVIANYTSFADQLARPDLIPMTTGSIPTGTIGDTGAYLNTTYFPDGVHHSALTASLLAPVFRAKLQSLGLT